MKKMFFVGILLFIVLFLVLGSGHYYAEEKKEYLVYIDAGHGGFDPGTSYENILEKDLNLQIANRLYMKLFDSVINVKTTRSGDYDLSTDNDNKKRTDIRKRVELVNKSKADLLISIHMNYFTDPFYFGAQVFYKKNQMESRKAAELFQENFREKTNTTRSASSINNIYLLDNVKVPAILIEAGFLSNKEERNLLVTPEYQEKIAEIIYISILSYFKI